MPTNGHPAPDEIYQLQTSCYLVLPGFLAADHVALLMDRLERVMERRREMAATSTESRAKTDVEGANTRIFHILQDDPALLDRMDYEPFMAYARTFL